MLNKITNELDVNIPINENSIDGRIAHDMLFIKLSLNSLYINILIKK